LIRSCDYQISSNKCRPAGAHDGEAVIMALMMHRCWGLETRLINVGVAWKIQPSNQLFGMP
jgi:hypothetical protein